MPSSASFPESKIPFAISLIVPSPPHAMKNFRPDSAAFRARVIPSPSALVNATLNAPKCARRSEAREAQLSPVDPPAERGLTITSGKVPPVLWLVLFLEFKGEMNSTDQ